MRPRGEVAGLYAYHNNPDVEHRENIRATRLAMACGMLSLRFRGNVLLVRSFGGRWEDLSLDSIEGPSCISPDLRWLVQDEIAHDMGADPTSIPSWLAGATQHNYHDRAALALVASAMNVEKEEDSDGITEKAESGGASTKTTKSVKKNRRLVR